MKYTGLYIDTHCVKDQASKISASKSLLGWKQAELSAENWIKKLDAGQTIQPSVFTSTDDGKFTHKIQYWQETYFVCADADNIAGVEFDDNGNDLNSDGIPYWTEDCGLSERLPELPNKVYAVGQSVSSMSGDKPPPHRRYRLIFLFDKPIQSEAHYHHVLLELAKEFPIIPEIKRSPSQPVFGNARGGSEDIPKFYINGSVLELDAYPLPEMPPEQRQPPAPSMRPRESLEDFLRRHGISYTSADTPDKFHVTCPFADQHASGRNGEKDAYVFDDGSAWSFNCSHTTCKKNGRATWQAFKDAHGIKGTFNKVDEVGSEPPEPVRLPPEETGDIPFPVDALKGTIFGEYEAAYSGRNETCPGFRFAELAFALGAVAGRKISLKSGVRPVYPNMYFALVGRSNFARKSESLYKIRKLIEEHETDTLITTSTLNSAEGLLNKLSTADDTRMVCLIDEFKAFFTKSTQKATEGLIPKLNEAFECPPKMNTLTKENPITAIRPNVNMIGCLTPQWFEDSMTVSNIGGGFINRIAFFLHEQMPLVSVSEVTSPDPLKLELIKRLIRDVAEMTTFRQFEFSNEVQESEKKWYHKTMTELLDKDDVIVDSTARVGIHVVKIALLLAYLQNSKNNLIHIAEWECARKIGDYLTKVNLRLFADLSFDKLTAQEKRVLRALDRCEGSATKRDLSNKIGRGKNGISARDLQRIIEALAANDIILLTNREGKGGGTLITRVG